MTLEDLKDIIPKDCDVGLTAKSDEDIPYVDKWGNWLNGGVKRLDVEISSISSAGYLLLELDI